MRFAEYNSAIQQTSVAPSALPPSCEKSLWPCMRKRRIYAIVIAVGILVGALVLVLLLSREPSYGGKRLSEWVDSYSYSIDRGRYTPKQRDQAILGIGTNALPYLLKWIRYDTRPWKSKLFGTLNPALKSIKPSWQLSDENEHLRADGSVLALITLSPETDATIAALSKLLNDPATSPSVRIRAENVLACIDRRSWKDPRRL